MYVAQSIIAICSHRYWK